MPQHDDSIRSALCIKNDPSLIGRVERIPCSQCAAALKQHAKVKGGCKGGILLLHTLFERGAPPAHTISTHSQNQTEQKRRNRGGKDEAGGESGAKMPLLLHF